METLSTDRIKIIETDPPTYLKQIIPSSTILLLFKKLLEAPVNVSQQLEDQTVVTDYSSYNALDLTGSPLKVNLDEDETLLAFQQEKAFHSWTDEEAKQYPLSICEARKHVGEYLRSEGDLPIYIICDGKENNTVILGAQSQIENGKRFTTTSRVKTLGYLSKDHEDLSLVNMEMSHLLGCGGQRCAINYLVQSKHYLYGAYHQTVENASETEYFGSICIEETSRNKCTIDTRQSTSGKTLILQVLVGHPKSPVHFLWQELCVVQSYLDIMSSSELCSNAETVICENPVSQREINHLIKDLVFQLKFWRTSKQAEKMLFDLSNIRDENITDKMWKVLRKSATLSDLRENFYILFHELGSLSSISQIIRNNNTEIGMLLNKIVEKGQNPSISLREAVKFLFELGIEKLREDYQQILKAFYRLLRESINNQWCKLSNLGQDSIRLGYLGNLHMAAELIYLCKETHLSSQSFEYFCSKVCKTYVETDVFTKFVEIQRCPLREFSVVLNTIDTTNNIGLPVTWSIQMTSKKPDVEVTTMYHFSAYSLFPPSIYHCNDILEMDDKKYDGYHITKLESWKYSM